ncbi:Spo0E like sporulation regulatory protein [Cytobacillus firmus]|uniref:Spo0E like sporulation regulatory protein n=2 Tax=Cytobacillus TaxID=2675230 RepID=A0A366JUP4_CYTFI|nr:MULTISPECIES: Spo0E family sporulation regulatory protein-aspartic acid phosphatase [Cytobacillus]RBP92934.1 Spo0E like sporulation regulatory protein [Cytobacillus firmus]TDX42536.1 Spo0E like sporulation regulatory protein [Cytobacillus oceanisediminis]
MCHFCRELRKKIHFTRKTLIETGIKKGLEHPETIKNSQILDGLIFMFQSKCK